jgi:hypothetical protein
MRVIIARDLQAIARPRKRPALQYDHVGQDQIQSHARQFDFLRALFTGSHPQHRIGGGEAWLRRAHVRQCGASEILRGARAIR